MPPNAPRQPRRWQRCEAKRVARKGSVQSRAQLPGRASGVVLHAVVSRRSDLFLACSFIICYWSANLCFL